MLWGHRTGASYHLPEPKQTYIEQKNHKEEKTLEEEDTEVTSYGREQGQLEKTDLASSEQEEVAGEKKETF